MRARVAVVVTALFVLLWQDPAVAAQVEVFVLAGQSNAVGFGSSASELPPELVPPQGDVRFWFEEGPFNAVNDPSRRISSGGTFVLLQFQTDPSGATFGGLTSGFGPEIRLGRVLADTLAPDIAIVKFAINATSLATDWNPSGPGPLYGQLIGIVNAALAALAVAGDTGEVAGFFWMQGEWDALNDTDAAKAAVASTVAQTAMVDTDDLPLNSDSLHFQAAGQLTLGDRFAITYLGLTATTSTNTTSSTTTTTTSSTTTTSTLPLPATCGASPVGGCLSPGKASLQVTEKIAGKERLKVALKTLTPATTQADFGDPVGGTTRYAVCVYDQTAALQAELQVNRAGQQCGTRPCWKALSTKGYRYGDREASADSISTIVGKAGDPGKGQAQAKGQNNAAEGQTSLPTGIAAALRNNTQATVQILTSDASSGRRSRTSRRPTAWSSRPPSRSLGPAGSREAGGHRVPSVDGRGTVRLMGSRYKLRRRPGNLIEPTLYLVKVRAQLKGRRRVPSRGAPGIAVVSSLACGPVEPLQHLVAKGDDLQGLSNGFRLAAGAQDDAGTFQSPGFDEHVLAHESRHAIPPYA